MNLLIILKNISIALSRLCKKLLFDICVLFFKFLFSDLIVLIKNTIYYITLIMRNTKCRLFIKENIYYKFSICVYNYRFAKSYITLAKIKWMYYFLVYNSYDAILISSLQYFYIYNATEIFFLNKMLI